MACGLLAILWRAILETQRNASCTVLFFRGSQLVASVSFVYVPHVPPPRVAFLWHMSSVSSCTCSLYLLPFAHSNTQAYLIKAFTRCPSHELEMLAPARGFRLPSRGFVCFLRGHAWVMHLHTDPTQGSGDAHWDRRPNLLPKRKRS